MNAARRPQDRFRNAARWVAVEHVDQSGPNRVVVVAAMATLAVDHLRGTARRLRSLLSHRRAFAMTALATSHLVGALVFAAPRTLDAAAMIVDLPSPPFDSLASESEVVAADGSSLGVVPGGTRRAVVRLADVAPTVRAMVLAAEDRRFYGHDGVDGRAIARAAASNLIEGEVIQGGSTITQQLAKRNFTGDDRTPARKVAELVHARALENELTKDDLLERYLNEVYFGAGAYGIGAASHTYFGRDVQELAPHQAALLASVIRAPSVLDPWERPGAVRERRDAVLRIAADDGAIDTATLEASLAAPLDVLEAPRRPPVADAQTFDLVRREIAELEIAGQDREQRIAHLRRAGWRIETSIDPQVQHAAYTELASGLGDGVAGSVALVEPGTGRIVAVANHQPGAEQPFPLASAARRQPGSAFKPFAAIAAVYAGLRLDQRFEGRGPRQFDTGDETWTVDNFEQADYSDVDLRQALVHSVNTAFAQIAVAVGTDRIAETAHALGISEASMGAPNQRGPALALGGVHRGVSPLELAESYAAIAAAGKHAPATVIDRIVDRDGRVLFEREREPVQAAPVEAVTTVREMLEGVVAEGTGEAAALPGLEAFGKTGTSQDRADAWFAGAVPQLAAVVWVGHADRREPMPSATGGRTAAPIWREVMSSALATSPPATFDPPIAPADNPGIPLPAALPCDSSCRKARGD